MKDYLKLENHLDVTASVPSTCIVEGKVRSPKVTIAIPTYKRANLLGQTIESALKQKSVCEFEVIVVDNNPERDDETEKLLASYNHERLYYYKNDKNLGLPGNWNRLFTLARGEWVVMVHDDDLLCNNFLEDIYPFLNMSVDIISGKFYPFYDSPDMDTTQTPLTATIIPFNRLWNGSQLTIAGLTIKKRSFEEIGGFNPTLQNLDCALITQMAYYKRALLINKPLAPYRIQCNDSMNQAVFENCIIGEYERQQYVLQKTLPGWLAKLIQINSTLSLVDGWNNQFGVDFKSPLFNNSGKVKRMLSKLLSKIYGKYLNIIDPLEIISPKINPLCQ